MSGQTLYDEDILLWSERQAEVIRRLRETARGLPNDLDIENVAEEIESVGRSELAAVRSYLRLILLHLIKLSAEADAAAASHWRGEISAFRVELMDRYARSMRQRIDLDTLWQEVRERISLDPSIVRLDEARLPETCPFALDDLIADRLDSTALAERLHHAVHPVGERGDE